MACQMSEASQGLDLPTVSVVLTTYGRKQLLRDVIAPLLADPATTEVLVVVDGSRDGSFELLQEIAADQPKLKPLFIENAGQVAAQEVGLEAAAGEVVLLLDDDVEARPGLVTGHARHHAASTGLVVVGYMPVRIPTRWSSSKFTTVLYAHEYERAARAFHEDPDRVLLGLWMGNVSLRRDDCLRIGLRNPRWEAIAHTYHADREFGLRCKKGGLEGVYDDTLRADHRHERSVDSFFSSARDQGTGEVAIHELHEDILGPIAVESFSAGLTGIARLLVRASRRRAVRVGLLGVLSTWIHCAGWVHSMSLQIPPAKLARRIEQRHGAIEAIQRRQAA